MGPRRRATSARCARACAPRGAARTPRAGAADELELVVAKRLRGLARKVGKGREDVLGSREHLVEGGDAARARRGRRRRGGACLGLRAGLRLGGHLRLRARLRLRAHLGTDARRAGGGARASLAPGRAAAPSGDLEHAVRHERGPDDDSRGDRAHVPAVGQVQRVIASRERGEEEHRGPQHERSERDGGRPEPRGGAPLPFPHLVSSTSRRARAQSLHHPHAPGPTPVPPSGGRHAQARRARGWASRYTRRMWLRSTWV